MVSARAVHSAHTFCTEIAFRVPTFLSRLWSIACNILADFGINFFRKRHLIKKLQRFQRLQRFYLVYFWRTGCIFFITVRFTEECNFPTFFFVKAKTVSGKVAALTLFFLKTWFESRHFQKESHEYSFSSSSCDRNNRKIAALLHWNCDWSKPLTFLEVTPIVTTRTALKKDKRSALYPHLTTLLELFMSIPLVTSRKLSIVGTQNLLLGLKMVK